MNITALVACKLWPGSTIALAHAHGRLDLAMLIRKRDMLQSHSGDLTAGEKELLGAIIETINMARAALVHPSASKHGWGKRA